MEICPTLTDTTAKQNCIIETSGDPNEYLFIHPFVPSFHDTFKFEVRAARQVYVKLSSTTYDQVTEDNSGVIYLIGECLGDEKKPPCFTGGRTFQVGSVDRGFF